ncbi:MAG: hypothetical protein E7Y34_01920 [Mycoplasma sp.]|nr:hypothetical protein [Mycoplasma sp.]
MSNSIVSSTKSNNIKDTIYKKIDNDLGEDFLNKLFQDIIDNQNTKLVDYFIDWVSVNFDYLTTITKDTHKNKETSKNNDIYRAYTGGFQVSSTMWHYYWYIPSWNRPDLWKRSVGSEELANDFVSLFDYNWTNNKKEVFRFFLFTLLPKMSKKYAKFALALSVPGPGYVVLFSCIVSWIVISASGGSGAVCRVFSPWFGPPIFTGSWSFEED